MRWAAWTPTRGGVFEKRSDAIVGDEIADVKPRIEDEIDTAGAVWKVPATRMKAKSQSVLSSVGPGCDV